MTPLLCCDILFLLERPSNTHYLWYDARPAGRQCCPTFPTSPGTKSMPENLDGPLRHTDKQAGGQTDVTEHITSTADAGGNDFFVIHCLCILLSRAVPYHSVIW